MKKEWLRVAMAQSAIDSGCDPEDFYSGRNKVVLSRAHPEARKYLALPFYCDLTSYGDNIVASVHPEIAGTVQNYIDKYPVEHCFETPNLQVLNDELKKHGQCVCFMAEYFLPDGAVQKPLASAYELKLLLPDDFSALYLPQWSNALCEKRKQLDRIAVGAFDQGQLIGLAGASADCETMWQIGVDVLPGYRKKGVAGAITSRLADEILQRGILPFYCAAWSNIASVRNAIKSGFKPAWVQVTAKSCAFVQSMNA